MTPYQTTKFMLDRTKLKAFADDKLNVAQMMIFFLSDRDKNIVGKGEKCCLPAFSPFPTMFSKAISYRVMELGLCGKGLIDDFHIW